MINSLWNQLTSSRLCFWILNLLSLNLVVGGLYAKFDGRYRQLNSELFFSWLSQHFDGHCWWLVTLMLLLLLLGANTLACSCQRIYQLWQRRHNNRTSTTLLLLCPTLMHLCFLLILSGHALTEFSGLKEKIAAKAGQQITIEQTVVEVLDQQNSYRTEGPLAGHLQQSRARLNFVSNGQSQIEEVAVLTPLWHNGITYHLALAGKTKQGQQPRLVINIKQDTGLPLILLGNGLMCLLMLIYFVRIRTHRHGGRS